MTKSLFDRYLKRDSIRQWTENLSGGIQTGKYRISEIWIDQHWGVTFGGTLKDKIGTKLTLSKRLYTHNAKLSETRHLFTSSHISGGDSGVSSSRRVSS